jgi:hypothetical protein
MGTIKAPAGSRKWREPRRAGLAAALLFPSPEKTENQVFFALA